jgi:hypothetical protein
LTPEVVRTPRLRDTHTSYPRSGFSLVIDVRTADNGRPLRPGAWDIEIAVGRGGVSRSAPIQTPAPAARSKSGDQAPATLVVSRIRGARLEYGQRETHRTLRHAPGVVRRRLRRVRRLIRTVARRSR